MGELILNNPRLITGSRSDGQCTQQTLILRYEQSTPTKNI